VRTREVETRRGIRSRLHEAGEGPALLYLHGAGGLLTEEPLLERLAGRFHVMAPEWPGYGESQGEEQLEDMLDFALHGWDLVEALGLGRPYLVGHSMGGMIAAEMAALAPRQLAKLALLAPAGLWMDEHPIPDLFARTPFELPALLFHDAARGEALLTAGLDFSRDGALEDFMVQNARRLGTAGKILFPIPNRRLAKRLYRITLPTLLVWGREDRLIPPVYAERFRARLPDAELAWVEEAGHMLTHERPEAVAEALVTFLA
jgi:pimeloyl-ACP methyl ester carboxylesterase